MMKLLIIACLVALTWQSASAQCTEVANCNSCSNPGPQCGDCPDGTVVSLNNDDCLDCGDFCTTCTADANDNVQCTECMTSYYLDDSNSCTSCGNGCMDCAMVDGVLTCNECMEDGYAHNTGADGQPCVECDNNCQKCSMADDLTSTICSKCYTYPGESQQGYFYKSADAAADRTCKTCGSKASACTDDGAGKASISSCYSDYEVQSSDNSRCLACPSTCETCNGEELSGSATCTSCKENSGVFLDNGECISCTDNCDTCEDSSNCAECKEEYRVDSGSCLKCPANCLECAVNEDSGNDECETCDESYGTKATTSVTCDKCTLSNCDVCTMSTSTGEHSCTTCSQGYGLDADNKCTACGSGCASCTWDAGNTRMGCDTCLTGYSSEASTDDPTVCIACTVALDQCTVCSGAAATPTCTACGEGYNHGSTGPVCLADIENCVAYALETAKCETCADTYRPSDDGLSCVSCDVSDCKTCAAAGECTACVSGFQVDTNVCYDCGVSRCLICTVAEVDGNKVATADTCSSCEPGYAVYDSSGTQSTTVGGQCRKCATGCDDCTWNYDDNAGSCSSCLEGYTTGETGTCVECPDNCAACSYADGSVSCNAAQCGGGYAKNEDSGECDACPENCGTCSWDTDLSAIACTNCKSGYGVISQGQCGECPANCDECSVTNSEEAPDLLTCSTCSSGYAKNQAVCAACSSNCLSCSDNDGTMECNDCKDGYALDSSTKECVSCFSNCDSCTASNGVVKCTECNWRYSLALDGLSCIICSEAAFENCFSCGDMVADSETAECESCNTGYVLQDMSPEGPCIDVSSLSCDMAYRSDPGPQCSACESGYTVTDNGLCAIECYVCGDMDSLTPVTQSACKVPSSNSTDETGVARVEECTTGICVSFWFTGDQIVAGCARPDDEDNAPTCTEEGKYESCETADGVKACVMCCEGADRCNDFIETMDGESAGIPTCTTNFLLLCGAALLAVIRNN